MAVYAPISSTSTFTSNNDGLLSSKIEVQEFADSHIDSGSIKSILCSLFDECETPYETTPYDSDLHALCLKEAALKGYPIGDGPDDIHPKRYLPGGVILASAAYGHLPRGHQVFIALYTAIVVWFDDRYAEGKDLHGVERFHERFLTKQKQETVGLDAMAAVMWDISTYWGSVQANVILISTLKYITGELLECKIKGMKLSSNFKSFSTYLRSLTGISEAYAMFVFPQEMGIWKYMQAMPDICKYIDGYNDVVSFYKEEKAKEVNNFITLEAASLNEDKMVVLERLAVDIGACSRRIDQVLGEHQDALEAFRAFKRGGLLFHTSLESRYRLGELFNSS